jgi:hypothetical protein
MSDKPLREFSSRRKLANGRTQTRPQFFADVSPHGTYRRYDEGCSCEACRAAKNAYQQAKKAERKANPDGVQRQPRRSRHATSTTLEDLLKEWPS